MSDAEKIAAIVALLQTDEPMSNTGKVLKMVLINTVPTLQPFQLAQLCLLLGVSSPNNGEENG